MTYTCILFLTLSLPSLDSLTSWLHGISLKAETFEMKKKLFLKLAVTVSRKKAEANFEASIYEELYYIILYYIIL